MSLEPSAQDPYADVYMNPPQPSQTAAGDPAIKERSPPPPARGRSRSRSPGRFRSPPRRRSPPPRRPGHAPIPQAPPSSNVLGVFGLSIRTQERDLEEEFNRFGRVEKVTIVYDQRSDRSRGFGFIRMSTVEEATRCIHELNGIDLNGRRIRVDFSITDRPHAPTPGEYMGHRSSSYRGRDSYRDRDREHYRDYRDSHYRDDRRGYPPHDRERDRDPYGREREVRDRRSPGYRGRYSPPASPRRRRSYSRSPPRGSGSSPSKPAYDGGHANGAPDANGRW